MAPMETARLILGLAAGLALPWALGGLWLRWLWRDAPGPGRWALVWGHGYLLGVLGVTLIARALAAFDLSFTALHWLLAALILLVPAWWFGRRPGTRPAGPPAHQQPASPLSMSHRVLMVALLALLLARALGLGLEILWRPLFPWDAAMHWATKARVWSEFQQLLPFVSAEQWLTVRGANVFTDYHPDYPPTIPLLQTWMNVLLGGWHDRLMNLPWLQCFVALGLAFYGQARGAGLGPLAALTFVYLLLSLPLLEIHVALAGYADLFLAFAYLAALMAFYRWASTRDARHAVLAVACALAAPAIKHEGLLWSLTLLPALAALWLGRRRFLWLTASALLAFGAALWFLPPDTVLLGGHRLSELQAPHWDAVPPLLNSLFVFGSWHLLFWLALGTLTLSIAWPRAWSAKPLAALGIALACAFALLAILFLATPYVASMPGHTSIGRVTLQLAPATLFLTAMWYRRLTALVETQTS